MAAIAGVGAPVPARPCPALLPDHSSCREVAAWVVEAVAAGAIESRAADVILGAVSRVTTSLARGHAETELESLRVMYEKMLEAANVVTRRERSLAYEASTTMKPTSGRTRVVDAEPSTTAPETDGPGKPAIKH